MRTECTSCHAGFRVDDSATGRTARCPKCGERFTVMAVPGHARSGAAKPPPAAPVDRPPAPAPPPVESTGGQLEDPTAAVPPAPISVAYARKGSRDYIAPTTRRTLIVIFLLASGVLIAFRAGLTLIVLDYGHAIGEAGPVPFLVRWLHRAIIGLISTNILLGGCMVAGMVLFFTWVYRACRNLKALGATDTRISPGWAVAWFFIPLVRLVMACAAMLQIERGSRRKSKLAAVLVWLWWACVLFTPLGILPAEIHLYTAAVHRDTDTLFSAAEMIASRSVLFVIPVVLTAAVVVHITDMQIKRWRQLHQAVASPQAKATAGPALVGQGSPAEPADS